MLDDDVFDNRATLPSIGFCSRRQAFALTEARLLRTPKSAQRSEGLPHVGYNPLHQGARPSRIRCRQFRLNWRPRAPPQSHPLSHIVRRVSSTRPSRLPGLAPGTSRAPESAADCGQRGPTALVAAGDQSGRRPDWPAACPEPATADSKSGRPHLARYGRSRPVRDPPRKAQLRSIEYAHRHRGIPESPVPT